VLNSPAAPGGVAVRSSSADAPVEATARHHGRAVYVFAVAMRGGKATATFTVPGMKGRARAEAIDEGRALEVRDGVFRDAFGPWGVHLYKVEAE
jgi:hypothetical protein